MLLTERQWEARRQGRESGQGSGGGNGNSGQNNRRGKNQNKRNDSRPPQNGTNDNGGSGDRGGRGRDMSKVKFYNCNKHGHFSRDCTEPQREREERVNLAQEEMHESALLLVSAHEIMVTDGSAGEHVLLNEEHSQALAAALGKRCDLEYTADQRGVVVIQLCFARHVLIFQWAR